MTADEKLAALKEILEIESADTSEDSRLVTYLKSAGEEILSWKYSLLPEEKWPEDVPRDCEQTQLWAVVAGYSQTGAEGQTSHSENGISRQWVYADMVAYIRSMVTPFVRIL